MAIDNVDLKHFPNLLLCCLESLVFLSKAKQMLYNNYIEQILDSTSFEKLFIKELDIISKNDKPTKKAID